MRNEHYMPGKAYRSKLEPFFSLIAENRRKRLTWTEIASLITDKGTQCTRQAVQGYFKRRVARRKKKQEWPIGMEAWITPQSFPIAAAEPKTIEPTTNGSDTYRRVQEERKRRAKQKPHPFMGHVISNED